MIDRRDVLVHPRRAMAFGSSLLLVAIALGVAASIHPGPSTADHRWAGIVVDGRTPFFTFLAERVFDTLGRFPFSWCIVGAAALILHHAGRSSAMWVLLAGEVASWGTNNVIKSLVDRPRPPGALLHASGSSYPSGHAAFAAVTAALLVALFATAGRRGPWTALGLVLAVGMAWSRTYLMVHWLTDVVGGLCVGAGVGLVALAVWSHDGREVGRPHHADIGSPP
jgi:undecaprenyl-diphosphatase